MCGTLSVSFFLYFFSSLRNRNQPRSHTIEFKFKNHTLIKRERWQSGQIEKKVEFCCCLSLPWYWKESFIDKFFFLILDLKKLFLSHTVCVLDCPACTRLTHSMMLFKYSVNDTGHCSSYVWTELAQNHKASKMHTKT